MIVSRVQYAAYIDLLHVKNLVCEAVQEVSVANERPYVSIESVHVPSMFNQVAEFSRLFAPPATPHWDDIGDFAPDPVEESNRFVALIRYRLETLNSPAGMHIPTLLEILSRIDLFGHLEVEGTLEPSLHRLTVATESIYWSTLMSTLQGSDVRLLPAQVKALKNIVIREALLLTDRE